MDESEKSQIFGKLNNHGCLCGIRVNDAFVPRRTSKRVAKCNDTGLQYSTTWISDVYDSMEEVIHTRTDRDSNYVHHGWSLDAATTLPPWSVSRVERGCQVIRRGSWTTKRATARRLAVKIPLDDIIPAEEFEAEIAASLDQTTDFERFQKLNEALDRWGDVLPLTFDLGASISITDTNSDISQLPNAGRDLRLKDLARFPAARVGIQGGDISTSAPDNIAAWLSKQENPQQWAIVRIIRVIPTTQLLREDLQVDIKRLYSRLISYCPDSSNSAPSREKLFDDTLHTFQPISSITIYTEQAIQCLCVEYFNGTQSDQYGGSEGSKHVFSLREGEFITEVITWLDDGRTSAFQFITSKGRISSHFGGSDGKPVLLNSRGGALVALSGEIIHSEHPERFGLYHVQTVWRHDLVPLQFTPNHHSSEFFGGTGGEPFNDWAFLKNSPSGHVSSVRVRSGSYVHSIQVTYRGENNRKQFVSPSWPHGGTGGLEDIFTLEPGEYITNVSGRYDHEKILQLYFTTNRGRVSEKYGRSSGKSFRCQAPLANNGTSMRLCFVMGKSSKCLNGIMFVWSPESATVT
ncbi:Zymogen granule protein 16 B [Ceratobasidium sp. 428]|nr:Zymogen granule protein 16 B [Ceratobasidium sp. 428]